MLASEIYDWQDKDYAVPIRYEIRRERGSFRFELFQPVSNPRSFIR